MKYRLTFTCGEPLSLPLQYNKILQAALLSWLGDNEYSSFLHDEGYVREKRKFKLYTFSRIFGEHTKDAAGKKIVFNDIIYVYISFYDDEAHSLILQNIADKKPLRFGRQLLPLHNCELAQEEYGDCIVDTVSPVTIHSTFKLPDGRKKTYYYNPREKDFSEMLRQNLIRKWEAYHSSELDDSAFEIKPLNAGDVKEVHVTYNRFVITGYSGRFRISGSKELLRMALLSGIGARNGIGFGCILQVK